MSKILSTKFFNRPADKVAKELLGKFLVRKIGGKEIVVMITETEAYMGPHDKACHAYKGRTKRNEPMFGEAGNWYVYFCYGMHWMLNIVTGPKDYPAAVLIRGVTCQLDDRLIDKCIVLNGPGKLTKFLKIDKKFNSKKADNKTGLWIEDRGLHPDSHGRVRIVPTKVEDPRFAKQIGTGAPRLRGEGALFACIKKSPRIGVDYAGEWKDKPLRFYIK